MTDIKQPPGMNIIFAIHTIIFKTLRLSISF